MGRMSEQEVTTVPTVPREFKVINKKLVLIGFAGLIVALLAFAFTGSSITGNAVYEGVESPELVGVPLSAHVGELAFPLESKQSIPRITLDVKGSSSRLYVGREGVTDLSKLPQATIEMSDFVGQISFDAGAILGLKGTVSKLSINGLPTAATTGEIRVRIEEPLEYETLELSQVFLSQYSSPQDSGKVTFNNGKIAMELDSERLLIEDFLGSLSSGTVGKQGVLRQGLNFEGHASNVEVGGDFQLSLRK